MHHWLNPRLQEARWHPVWFAAGLIAPALILASWLWPPTRAWWDMPDAWVFHTLNGQLEGKEGAQVFWAVANHRAFDLVPGVLILLIYAHYLWQSRRHFWEGAAIGMFILILTLCAAEISHELTADRDSPSRVLKPAILLSEQVPWAKPKDQSGHSFPGDHAMVMLIVTFCIGFFTGWGRGMLSLLVTCLGTLPRLVSGAHWLTDIAVGAFSVALAAAAIGLATPLYAIVARGCYRLLARFGRRITSFGWG